MYRYLQGTSMAGSHAAGVAALIISRYGDVQNPFDPAVGSTRPDLIGRFVAECQGAPDYYSFYGYGQVNALRAILHDTANR